MKRAVILALAAVIGDPAAAQRSEPFDVAITVDDLPAHGRLPRGTSRAAIAEAYLAALKAHGVPEATHSTRLIRRFVRLRSSRKKKGFPAVAALPKRFIKQDELYVVRNWSRRDMNVLLRLDEA